MGARTPELGARRIHFERQASARKARWPEQHEGATDPSSVLLLVGSGAGDTERALRVTGVPPLPPAVRVGDRVGPGL